MSLNKAIAIAQLGQYIFDKCDLETKTPTKFPTKKATKIKRKKRK